MIVIELGRPAFEPASLEEVKSWARIERGDEDALLGTLVTAAREVVEAQTGLVLARRAFRLCIEPGEAGGPVDVARGPVQAILAVRAYGADGTSEEFAVTNASSPGTDRLRIDEAVRRAGANGIEVEFEAGYDVGELPEALKIAILRIVATAYETRAAFGGDMQPAIVPPLAAALIAPFRKVRL